ncbi:fibronectin type III domain-containing protein [Ruminococcus bromii]|uniref:fibronectin type III domain-containing protein n=1 Tax=Ruminococcus bromii TaxID=40518 RepID=UPI0039F60EFE
MKKFLPIAMAAVMSMSAVAVSAVPANAVEPLNTPVQYAQVARASLATPKISKAESVYGGVKLTWNKVNGAAKYRVYYKGRKGWTRMVDTTSTSYIDKDVSSGRNYTYTVRCISADGKSFTSGYDSKGKSVKYIAAPEISKLENVNGGVKISWGKVNGAAKYRVYYKGRKGWTRMVDTTSTSYIDKDVSSGRNYTYTVRCISDDGKSFESGFNPKGSSIRYNQAPKILETNVVNGGIKVIWETENNTNYRLYCKTEGKGWTKVCDNKTGVVTHKNLQPNKTYTYTVRAISSDAKKYLSGYDPVGMSAKYVATPKISKTEVTYDGVKLTWNKVAGAEKYRVYYKDGEGWNKLADTTGNSYLDMGLVSRELSIKDNSVNGQYIYTVRCISSNGKVFQSGYDTKGSKANLGNECPEIVRVDSMHGGITVSWTDVCEDNSKYRIYVKEKGSWKKLADTTNNYYTHKNVKAGQTYTYTVRCVSKDGKKFTSIYNPSGVTFKYKTTDKTRDAYIDYLLKHESEWLPELKVGNVALAGVQFADLDFDGVPELIVQEAGNEEYYLKAKVYTFKDGKFSLVGFDDYRTYIPNQLTYFYDKSAKKYIINAVELSTSNVDRYLDCENYTLNYDGTVLVVRGYSCAHLALESRGLEYYYYNQSGRTTKQAYNATNMSVLGNCVNAHMYSQFVYCSVDGYPKLWNSYSETQKKQHLTDSYNAFSYDKY